MKLKQVKAGMLIAYKARSARYGIIYIKKVTPKKFRLLQFITPGYGNIHNFIFKRLWPKDLMGEKIRLASDKEKTVLFNNLFNSLTKIE